MTESTSQRENLESCPTCGSESRNVRVCLSCNVTHPIYAHVEKTCSDSWHRQAALDSSPQRLLLEALEEIASLAELPAGAEFHNPLAIIKTIHECAESAIKQNGDAKTKMAALDSSPAKVEPQVTHAKCPRCLQSVRIGTRDGRHVYHHHDYPNGYQCPASGEFIRPPALDSSVPKESGVLGAAKVANVINDIPMNVASESANPAASTPPQEAANKREQLQNWASQLRDVADTSCGCPTELDGPAKSPDSVFRTRHKDSCEVYQIIASIYAAGQASVSDPPTPRKGECPLCASTDPGMFQGRCREYLEANSSAHIYHWHTTTDAQRSHMRYIPTADDRAAAADPRLKELEEAEPDWHAFYTESQTERFHEQEVTATLQEELASAEKSNKELALAIGAFLRHDGGPGSLDYDAHELFYVRENMQSALTHYEARKGSDLSNS